MAMYLTSLTPTRGAPGEDFVIHGRDFGLTQRGKIPSINRGRAYPLEVRYWARWFRPGIGVRIPLGLPSGMFKVLIYYDATYHTSSNSLDFWVTAAPVPAGIIDP